MFQFFARLKHHAKVLVGTQIGRLLEKRYFAGRGPAGRVISGFSEQAKRIGVRQKLLIEPSPLNRPVLNYFLNGKTEDEYRHKLLSGEDATIKAGIFSTQNAEITFPTGMHKIDGYILSEAILAPYLLTNPKYYLGYQSLRFRKKRKIDEGVLLSMPFYHNYYHWLIEILPRLLLYDRCSALQDVPIIVPKSAPNFVTESLRLSGYHAKSLYLDNGAYNFKKLHMLSRLGTMLEVSPDAINWLNNKFEHTAPTLVTPKRVYVSRGDANIRFVSNEYQLVDVLSKFGFESLAMSGYSLPEQIKIFRDADFIIGPHGAALSNLAFSKPGASVIEFFARGHFAPCFNRISTIRGLKYGFLVGEPTRFGGFAIDPADLRAILAQAL